MICSECDNCNKHARQVLRSNKGVKVVEVAALEDLDHAREHGGPGLKHVQLGHEAHGDRIVCGHWHLVLHCLHVLLEARNLQVGRSAQLVADSRENLLECILIDHFKDLFAEADGTSEGLLALSLLEAVHNLWHEGRHARLERVVVEVAQLLEAQQLLVNNMNKHLLVLQLTDIVEAALDEDLGDLLDGVEARFRAAQQDFLLARIAGSLEYLDQLLLRLGRELHAELLEVDGHGHFLLV